MSDPEEFRTAVIEALIDHQIAIQVRRLQRTGTIWPDESDIYTETIERLWVLLAEAKHDQTM
jgi:hypothetical protein